MNCPTCHAPIPDELISCRACALRKSREMVLQQQKDYLPEVLTSVRELTLTRQDRERQWHILLQGVQRQTYCGTTAQSCWRRRRTRYGEMQYIAICPSCNDTLERLVREIAEAEVR